MPHYKLGFSEGEKRLPTVFSEKHCTQLSATQCETPVVSFAGPQLANDWTDFGGQQTLWGTNLKLGLRKLPFGALQELVLKPPNESVHFQSTGSLVSMCFFKRLDAWNKVCGECPVLQSTRISHWSFYVSHKSRLVTSGEMSLSAFSSHGIICLYSKISFLLLLIAFTIDESQKWC